MLMQTAYSPLAACKPFLAYCPRCKDRVRFDVGTPNLVVCNCTATRWGYAHNVVRITTIKATVTAHTCDARCMNATGGVCECSCGGKNHGGRYSHV